MAEFDLEASTLLMTHSNPHIVKAAVARARQLCADLPERQVCCMTRVHCLYLLAPPGS